MRSRAAVWVSVWVLTLGACSQPMSGSVRPENASPSDGGNSNPTSAPADGIPRVQEPIDTARFERSPCDSLTADQVTQLGLPPKGRKNSDRSLAERAGNDCIWEEEHGYAHASVLFPTNVENGGLKRVYAVQKQGRYAYFREMEPIDGYPLVAAGRIGPDGACSVNLGVASDMAVQITIGQSAEKRGKEDACNAARRVAGMVFTTLKAGS